MGPTATPFALNCLTLMLSEDPSSISADQYAPVLLKISPAETTGQFRCPVPPKSRPPAASSTAPMFLITIVTWRKAHHTEAAIAGFSSVTENAVITLFVVRAETDANVLFFDADRTAYVVDPRAWGLAVLALPGDARFDAGTE